MRILNLFADADGESHFREVDIECTNETPWGLKLSKRLPAAAILCRRHEHRRCCSSPVTASVAMPALCDLA